MSGKFRSALTALSQISVPGVAHNFDLDAIPDKVARAVLPALIVAPTLDATRRRKYGEFQIATPSGATASVNYLVTHLLLYSPIGAGKGVRSSLPGLIDLVDSYANAIRANPKLNGTLFTPTVYSVYIAPISYAGCLYQAAQFWHVFTLEV